MFSVAKIIRFHHCDPAGIVFFPQYLVLCHEVLEDWIEEGLSIGFEHLLKTRGLGTPTVKLHAEFVARSSFRDVLIFELAVRKLGNSSMTLLIRAHVDGQERLRAELVVVLAELATFKSVPIPDDIRVRMMSFMATADTIVNDQASS